MSWKRARSPEEIEERRSSIIKAAEKLFRKNNYEDISLNTIADRAGLAKSNVYRYFSTREEIFLTIYMSLVSAWSEDLLQFYRALPISATSEKFADGFVKVTLNHEDMLSLCSVLFVSLEKNSSVDQLREFKRLSIKICSNHYDELKRVYPKMSFDDVVLLLKLIHSGMAAFWGSAQPNKGLKKVLEEEEFQSVAHHFTYDMKKAIQVYVRGILSNSVS